ncbi:hypothetical protein V2J09_005312 [Rumex salicifolius]
MSTATQDYRSVDIPIEDEHSNTRSQSSEGGAGSGGKTGSGDSRLTKWFNWLRQCLQNTGDSGLTIKWLKKCRQNTGDKSGSGEELAAAKRGDIKAYRKLFDDLNHESTDYPFSVKMWVVNVIILVIFIILVITFASVDVIHKEWLLHVRIHSWVALLMVIISGYPFIRFSTFVVSEPFVWLWRMNKYVYFFAIHLKKSVDVTLWFTLVLWVWFTWFRPRVLKDTRGTKTLHIPVELYKEEVKVVVKQITRMLMALSIGALIWTLKSVVFLKLVADLHYTELCERIRQTILDLHGIQFIDKKGRWSFLENAKTSKKDTHEPTTSTDQRGSGREDQGDFSSFWMCVSRLKRKTAPIWILKRLTYTYLKHMKKKPEVLSSLENVNDDEKLVEEANNMLKLVTEGQNNPDDDITCDNLAKYWLEKKEIDRLVRGCAHTRYMASSLGACYHQSNCHFVRAHFICNLHLWGELEEVFRWNHMKVSEMNIMTTIFIKYDTGVEAIYPNSELSTKAIINLDVTPDQPDIIEFNMPIDTPEELIFDLQVKIKKTLDDDPTYTSDTAVAKKSISDTEVTLIVYFKYLVPYLSAETKALHRSRIFSKIINLRKEIELLKKRMEQEVLSQKETSILSTLHDYNPSLKDGSQVLFTKITKQDIIMDVRMSYPINLFKPPRDKNKLKELIEHAVDDGLPNQSTPPSDHSTRVDIGGPEDAENREKTNACTRLLTVWFYRLKKCLRETGSKSVGEEQLAAEKTEDGKAYKKLFEVLGKEPKDNPFSVIMWIIHFILLVIFIILVTTFASVHVIHKDWVLHKRIHSWVALLMVVVSGYPAIRFVTFVVSEPLVWVWKMKKYAYFFAKYLKKSVDVTLWFILVLWVWYTWFRPQEYKEDLKIGVKQITRFLMALSIGAIIWTVKSAVFLKLLADLHFTELCKRIRQTILDYHGIQFIANRGKWQFLSHQQPSETTNGGDQSGKKKSRPDDDERLSFWMCVSRLKKETAPIWILKKLIDSYMENMRHKPEILRRLENYGLEDKEINHVLKLFTSEEDGKPSERITQDQFLRWAVLAVKNCLGLERTVESSKHIFWKLDVLMSACVVVITLVVWLLLSELVTTGQMAILFAPFLSASFIFGESLKRSFDGIIFMKVSEMHILTTKFIKYDAGVEAIYPNSELSTKAIINLDITPDQPDIIEFNMNFDTPQELIFDLQVKIKKTLDDDLTYTSNTAVAKKLISNSEVTLIVYFKYLVSYLSAETKALHRSRIFSKIINLLKETELLVERMKKEDLSQKETSILRFKIDVKVKMSKIDKLKDTIMRTLHDYNPSLKDGSQVLFTKITKQDIIMDVRMSYPINLFKPPGDKNKLKERVEHAVDDGLPNQREEKKVEVSWL